MNTLKALGGGYRWSDLPELDGGFGISGFQSIFHKGVPYVWYINHLTKEGAYCWFEFNDTRYGVLVSPTIFGVRVILFQESLFKSPARAELFICGDENKGWLQKGPRFVPRAVLWLAENRALSGLQMATAFNESTGV